MKSCENCYWFALLECVCCNSESQFAADFVDFQGCCERWKNKKKEGKE